MGMLANDRRSQELKMKNFIFVILYNEEEEMYKIVRLELESSSECTKW